MSQDLNAQIKISVLDAFSAPMKKLGLELKAIDGELGSIDKKGKKVGGDLAAGLNQAAEAMGRVRDFTKNLLTEPLKQFASLDQALAKLSAKTGEGRGSAGFQALRDQAEQLGAATRYSAEQVAGAQAEFAASGRDTQEILASIPSTLSLATAASIDLARATEITNEVLNQFNLSAADTAHVQDVLARADEVSAASVEGLGEALSYAGATAARLNIPLETTAALLATLSNAGQKGSTAGTNLAAFLTSLTAPSRIARKALHEMGLSQREIKQLQSDVAEGNIDQVIQQLAELNAGLDGAKSNELLARIFGDQGGRAASVLFRGILDTSDKGLLATIKQFGEAEGAVDRTAKIMESSFAGALERASGAISSVVTKFGEVLAPSAEALAGSLEKAAGYLQEFIEKHPEAAQTLGKVLLVAAAVTTIVAPILTFSAAIAGMAALWPALGTAVTAIIAVMTGPLGLAAAIALTVGALYTFRHEIGDWISELFGRKKGGADGTVNDPAKRGISVHRGGWELRDGKIWKMGDINDAPELVREAMERTGSRNQDDLNAYLADRQGAVPLMLRGVPGAQPFFPATSPWSVPTSLPKGKGAVVPSLSVSPIDDSGAEQAIREQTVLNSRAQDEQTELLRLLLDETRKRNRPTLTPTPVAR